jgi:KAP family P-loop domain.
MKRYQSDRAARKRVEDLLGRVPFAEQLADALVGWREDESLVVSLTGAWGSGKTSIKNFVLDALERRVSGVRSSFGSSDHRMRT